MASITDANSQESVTDFEKLDLEGKFMLKLMEDLTADNEIFLDDAVFEIENFFGLEMIKIMFDHNLKYKEFVYIFEDFFNNAEPHTERLEKNIMEAEQISYDLEDAFLEDLAKEMHDQLTVMIGTFIAELKEKEKKNGGFPNTDLMINALEEHI
jgi:hypothetical protein